MMGTRARTPSPRVGRRQRRGTVYLAVLGTCLLVTVIGLGAMALARTSTRLTVAQGHRHEAAGIARGVLDATATRLGRDNTWRSRVAGAWITDEPLDGGTYSVWVDDPEDGDLDDDPLDPVQIRVAATRGTATERIEAILTIQERVDALAPRLLAGGGIGISGSTIRGAGELRANGPLSASTSTVALEATSLVSVSGSAFDGVVRIADTSEAVPTPADLAAAWRTDAESIDRSLLPVGGTNLLDEGSFEDGLDGWEGSKNRITLAVDAQDAVEGARSLLVTERRKDDDIVSLDITEIVRSGVLPRATVRMRLVEGDEKVELRIRWNDGDRTTLDAGPEVEVSSDAWSDLEVTSTIADPADIEWATLEVSVDDDRAEYRLDDVRIFDSAADAAAPLVLQRVALGPDTNPYGDRSIAGHYLLDAAGRSIIIRDCRIVGTLLLQNPGPGSRIEGSVSWRPVEPGDPILITNGVFIQFDLEDAPLCEATAGVSLDPAELPDPHPGVPPSDALDACFESRLEGIVVAGGTVMVSGTLRLDGTLTTTGSVSVIDALVVLKPGAVTPERVPVGFAADRTVVTRVPGSLRRTIDAP